MDRLRVALAGSGRYLREVRGELKRVIWPDRKQIMVLTAVVVLASAFVGALIWLFDSIVSALMSALLGR